jgi:hypothetical protein
MVAAEAPRLDNALARHQLDLPALDAAAHQRELLALLVADARGLTRRGLEPLAVGEHRVDLLRRRIDDRFLVNRHVRNLWVEPTGSGVVP